MFVPNLRDVVLKSWSVRFVALGIMVEVSAQFYPEVLDFLPWWMQISVLGLIGLARVVAQTGLSIPKPQSNEDLFRE